MLLSFPTMGAYSNSLIQLDTSDYIYICITNAVILVIMILYYKKLRGF